MNGTGLTNLEIQDLINKYKSELRKLDYQTNDIKATIAELEELIETDLKRQDTTVTTRRKERENRADLQKLRQKPRKKLKNQERKDIACQSGISLFWMELKTVVKYLLILSFWI